MLWVILPSKLKIPGGHYLVPTTQLLWKVKDYVKRLNKNSKSACFTGATLHKHFT